MALGNPQVDPAILEQLYGTSAPDLYDASAMGELPAWPPPSWNAPAPAEELLAQSGAPMGASLPPFASPTPALAPSEIPGQTTAAVAGPPPPTPIDLGTPTTSPHPGTLQPGLGVPISVLDAVVPPAPMIGPPEAPPTGVPVSVGGPQPQQGPPWALNAPPPGIPLGAPSAALSPVPFGSEPAGPLSTIAPEQLFPTSPPPPPEPGALPPGVSGPLLPIGERTYQQTAAMYDANPLLDPTEIADPAMRRRYLNEMFAKDPVRAAEVAQRHEGKVLQDLQTKQMEARNRDYDRQLQNFKDRQENDRVTQQKMDAVWADVQRINATKIDPSGGLSGGQRIAGVIASIIGGLVQGRTGSAHNAGLDALNDTINRGIDAQKADLQNQREGLNLRRTMLSDEFARHGNEFVAQETLRLAALKHADDQLAFEQQKYERGGTTDIRIAGLRAGVAGQLQSNAIALRLKLQEADLKERAERRQEVLAVETARNNRAQLGLGYARLKSEDENRREAREARLQTKADAAQAAKDKQVLDRAIGGELTPVKDAQGKTVGKQYGYITKANGEIWVPNGTEAQISDLQKQHSAATQLVQTLDEIRRIGPEWLSDTANSDKLQRLKELIGDARLQTLAAKNLGVPTGHDIELAENFLGTTDPTRRKDSLAGLMQARASLVRDHNATLRTHGLDKEWNPTDLGSLPEAPASAGQLTAQHLLEKPNIGPDRAYSDELHYQADRLGVPRDPSGNGVVLWGAAPQTAASQATESARAAREEYRDISPDQRHALDALRQQATAGDTGAVDTLRKVAAEAHSRTVKQLAKQALDAVALGPGGPVSPDVRLPDFTRAPAPTFSPADPGAQLPVVDIAGGK